MAGGRTTRPESPRRSLARTRVPVSAWARMQTRAQAQVRVQAQARARASAQAPARARPQRPGRYSPKEQTSSQTAAQRSGRRPCPHQPIQLHNALPNSQRHDAEHLAKDRKEYRDKRRQHQEQYERDATAGNKRLNSRRTVVVAIHTDRGNGAEDERQDPCDNVGDHDPSKTREGTKRRTAWSCCA